MRVVVLGAGLMGVTSAYYLRLQGFEVDVIDRQKDVAQETSFANGGQISVCYSEPWSSISNLKKMLQWIGKEDSPLLLKPQLNWHQISWFTDFLWQCLPHNNKQNIIKLLNLAAFSRKELQELRKDLFINYEEQTNGILTFYTSEKSFEKGKESAQYMSRFGCQRDIKSKDEVLELEPSLSNCSLPIFGADYSADDESGDALLFTQKLSKVCEYMGVNFHFEKEIIDVKKDKKSISEIITKNAQGEEEIFGGDLFLNCLGSYSTLFMKKIGLPLNIYPAKGYSVTIPILQEELINQISLTDSDYKIVLTRLGNQLRVAGTAEFNGYDLSMNEKRCDALIQRAIQIHPNGLDYANATKWCGLRPATPGMTPIIERSKYDNLFINSGHGTLGWTMACGSGKIIAEMMKNNYDCVNLLTLK